MRPSATINYRLEWKVARLSHKSTEVQHCLKLLQIVIRDIHKRSQNGIVYHSQNLMGYESRRPVRNTLLSSVNKTTTPILIEAQGMDSRALMQITCSDESNFQLYHTDGGIIF